MIIQIEMGPGYQQTVSALGSTGAGVLRACSKGLGIGANFAAGVVGRDYLSGQSLKSRTGMLRESVTGWMAASLEAVVGVMPDSPVSKYAWLLGDEEKTIVPKNAKFLTIPIGENLTPSGAARYSSPRQVADGFFVKTKGRLLFGYKKGKKGKFRPLFTLVKSVFIQGSGALYDGVMDSLDDMAGAMETEIGKVVR